MPELKVDLDHAFAVRSVVLGLIGVGWDCKVYGPHMYPATEESEGDKSTAKRWRKGIQDGMSPPLSLVIILFSGQNSLLWSSEKAKADKYPSGDTS